MVLSCKRNFAITLVYNKTYNLTTYITVTQSLTFNEMN
jgi:hypothetical protein